MRLFTGLHIGCVALVCVVGGAAEAQVAASPPAAHPLYVAIDDAAADAAAKLAFATAATKLGLGPVETVDLPPEPAPKAGKTLAAAVARFKELAFDEVRSLLLPAVEEAMATGANGLSQEELCNLHLYLAMAYERADWHDLPEGGPPAPPPEAWQAYLQAAALCPQRQLYQRTFPPVAVARHAAAVAENKRRGEGTLVINAASDALISVDGRPVAAAPVSLSLPFGQHYIRVERPGRRPWANVVPLSLSRVQVDVPDQIFKTFADADAADHARRMSAAFALVAELKPGAQPAIELRLVEVITGKRIDSTRVALTGEVGGVFAAVMRMDEQARRRDLLAQQGALQEDSGGLIITSAPTKAAGPPENPTQDPGGWAKKRWPVLVAVGSVITTALVLGLAVALDDKMAVQ
ncbi:MAG: PEGA domain-containing protein [Deltaproteobacteria bacterium]|nr:PEGA domain-containing protein [Deltaproteobacteria bacterium]